MTKEELMELITDLCYENYCNGWESAQNPNVPYNVHDENIEILSDKLQAAIENLFSENT